VRPYVAGRSAKVARGDHASKRAHSRREGGQPWPPRELSCPQPRRRFHPFAANRCSFQTPQAKKFTLI
jgi:hypothetical protein